MLSHIGSFKILKNNFFICLLFPIFVKIFIMTKDELVFIAERAGFKCLLLEKNNKEYAQLDRKNERFIFDIDENGSVYLLGTKSVVITEVTFDYSLSDLLKQIEE